MLIWLNTSALHSSIPKPGVNPNCHLCCLFIAKFLSFPMINPSKNFTTGETTIGRYWVKIGIFGCYLFKQTNLAVKCILTS